MQWLIEAPAGLAYSLVHRPYVFALLAIYLVLATWHLGLARVLRMTVVGYAIAWASELSSIHNGFPYGPYRYLPEALQGDLVVAGVPFFDSLSYVFLCYFGWASASFLLGDARRHGRLDVRLSGDPAVRRTLRALLLGAALTTWIDVVVDPVSHLGDRWFLGRIYEYVEPGLYFDVPLSNFLGWLLVTALIVGAYQLVDRACDGRPARFQRELPGQALLAPAAYGIVVSFGLTVTLWIGEGLMGAVGLALQLPVLFAFLIRLRRTVGSPRPAPRARQREA